MLKTTILCIGHPENPHIQQVQRHVKSLDNEGRMVIFSPGLEGHFIEITQGNLSDETSGLVFIVDGERVSSNSITSVWYNVKPGIQENNEDLQEHIANNSIDKEWQSVILSLEPYLSHARWLNPLTSLRWNTKAYQLQLAQEVGLSVPRTTITNNGAAVEKLLEQGRVVFKTMSPLMVSGCPMFISDEITKEFLSESQTGIARCPSLYQEVVKRGSELRIFVVDQMVSAVRIVSQALDEKKIDGCSNSKPKQVFTKVQVPDSFKGRLLEYHKRAGLVFSTYEFVERGDDIIFLDCNPEGAWVCLEREVGLEVSEHIARYLLGRNEKVNREQFSFD